MTRFPAGIGIINASLKTHKSYCEFPSNKLLANTLRLFRNAGYIWGFCFMTPQKRYAKLYPRIRVFLKYIYLTKSLIRQIHTFKRTRSNYKIFKSKNLKRYFLQHKLYVITTSAGLNMTSIENVYHTYNKQLIPKFGGKYLAEIQR